VPSTDSRAAASPSTERTPAQFTNKGDCERAGVTWHRFTQKAKWARRPAEPESFARYVDISLYRVAVEVR